MEINYIFRKSLSSTNANKVVTLWPHTSGFQENPQLCGNVYVDCTEKPGMSDFFV